MRPNRLLHHFLHLLGCEQPTQLLLAALDKPGTEFLGLLSQLSDLVCIQSNQFRLRLRQISIPAWSLSRLAAPFQLTIYATSAPFNRGLR
jgi:hypothetical protein